MARANTTRKTSNRKPAAHHTPARATLASHTGLQYLIAFLAGAAMPFVGGILASAVSADLWSLQASGMSSPEPAVIGFINASVIATISLVYVLGLVALIWVSRQIKLTLRGTGLALLVSGIVAIVANLLPYALYTSGATISAGLGLCLDIAGLVLFGAGYVLGWWLVRRYAKLSKVKG